MSTALKHLITRHQSGLLRATQRQTFQSERWVGLQQRYRHTGVIDPHRLRKVDSNVPGCNKLLRSIRKSDQQAVWTHYMAIHEAQKLDELSPEYHSMVLRALGLQNLVAFGPEEIQAIKERLMMIWANMKHHGHTLDIRDYNHMLGFAGRASDWTLAERIWAELQENSTNTLWGLSPNVYSYNAYMVAAIQAEKPEKVPSIFNTMQLQAKIQPNVSSYNTLMDAYGRLGDVAEVDRLFDRVFVKQQPIKHTKFALHPQRIASSAFKQKIATLTRHANLTPITLKPNISTFTSLIDAHGRHGNTLALETISTKLMPEFNIQPTLSIYNAMIRWYCMKSDIDSAKKLIVEMKNQGVQPNIVTFNYIFRHEAIKRNRPGVAERLLDMVHQMYQLKPLQSMYRQLIRIHGRQNRFDEVERLLRIHDASFKPSSSK